MRRANSTLVTVSENHFPGLRNQRSSRTSLSFRLNKRYNYWYTFIAKPLIPATHSTYTDVVSVYRLLLYLNFYVHAGLHRRFYYARSQLLSYRFRIWSCPERLFPRRIEPSNRCNCILSNPSLSPNLTN